MADSKRSKKGSSSKPMSCQLPRTSKRQLIKYRLFPICWVFNEEDTFISTVLFWDLEDPRLETIPKTRKDNIVKIMKAEKKILARIMSLPRGIPNEVGLFWTNLKFDSLRKHAPQAIDYVDGQYKLGNAAGETTD